MRLPNSYGSVYKLSGKRRKPWAVRITADWELDEEGKKARQKFKYLGYYTTRSEAIKALAEYNTSPYDIDASKVTFAQLYEQWAPKFYEKVSKSTARTYKIAYGICAPIYEMPILEIKLAHLQTMVDKSGKNEPILKIVKTLLYKVYEFAIINEIIEADKQNIIRYVDISKGNPDARPHKRIEDRDIEVLWKNSDDENVKFILMLIYSGTRISELMELKAEDIDLNNKCFYIRKAKTKAGIREVPIADKTFCFFEYFIKKENTCLMPISYANYLDKRWNVTMEHFGMDYRPHDTRHTCISLLTSSGTDERVIKQIVGHLGNGVTEQVYTHIDLKSKLAAINSI